MAQDINRRDFLKLLGGAIAGTTLLSSCNKPEAAHSTTQVRQDGKMTFRTNPATGDRVSLLGYGMMRLPVEGGGSARENPDAKVDQEMVNRLVDHALEHGVNYFDTSPAYCKGESERATGTALARHDRKKYLIATKLSNFAPESQTRKASMEMFENSLRELQTDYVDYMLLHSVGGGSDSQEEFNNRYIYNGILDWLVEQKKKGRIRNLGFSYHGDVKIFDLLLRWHDEGRYRWDFVQIEMNYLDWNYADEINPRNTDAEYLYSELHRRRIPAVIMEPLLGGRLAKVPDHVAEKMKRRAPESSVASWAFRFAGTPDGILTVLSGMTYMEHLKDNLRTYSPLMPISDDENNFLMEIAHDIYNLHAVPCTGCNYCMPCPYGVNIPALFAHYNKCINEGNIPHEKQHPDYRRARRAFLVGQDRAVPLLRQADHCIGCGQCIPHCPQRIMIPDELHKIDSFTEQLKRNL